MNICVHNSISIIVLNINQLGLDWTTSTEMYDADNYETTLTARRKMISYHFKSVNPFSLHPNPMST